MKKIPLNFSAAVFCATLLFAGGCRSYNDEVWKTVDFASTPDRATLFINGENCGLTPRTARLSRSLSYEVRFSKPGYFDENRRIEPSGAEEGAPDLPDSVIVELTKITPEALAARERRLREQQAADAPQTEPGGEGVPATSAENASAQGGVSPAAAEFARSPKPANFTDFRLQEKALKDLLLRGKITEDEYRALHEKLDAAYNEKRLLKAPRLDTYENPEG